MRERLSFYIPRESFLHRLNPLTKLTLVFASILVSYISPWYWTGLTLLGLVFLLSFAGRVQREYLRVVLNLLAPVAGFLFVMQAFFLPGGETELWRLWFLSLKAENLAQAFQNATRIMVMVSTFILLILTTHPSELMGDLTRRGLPATIAYVITATLQILPQMQAKAATIIDAQRSRGLQTDGSFTRRVAALLPLIGPLVFGSLVEVEERAIAIEARAFMASTPRTSLRELPDSTVDQSIRWLLVAAVLVAIAGRLWLS